MANEPNQPPIFELLGLLLGQANEHALILLDENATIVGWFAGAERILGYRTDEVLGRTLEFLFTPEDRERGTPQLEVTIARKNGQAEDDRWQVRKDGGLFWASGALAATGLPDNLTPVGAERAASPDGRIPAWQGGLSVAQQRLGDNGTPLDPYAAEQPLYRITAANYRRYQGQLSDGQVALLKRFPHTFELPVYPTHRSVAVPAGVAASAARNAAQAQLDDQGNGLRGFNGVIAFPRPDNGLEVI